MTVFRNGKPIAEEEFDDIAEGNRAEAMRKWHRENGTASESIGLSGGNLTFGTPRKGKNTRFAWNGVRVS